MKRAYTNCRIFTGREILDQHAIITENGKIVTIIPSSELDEGLMVEQLDGHNIAPAFIDLQIYGGNGQMFSQELSIESLRSTYEYCLAGGAAYFMITMATNSIEKFVQGIAVVREYMDRGGKGLLGLHLEGPYLNTIKRGAHIAHYIKTPDIAEVSMLLEKGRGVFKMMTLAPEQCNDEITAMLINNGIIVSAGHSNATYSEARRAFQNGIPAATHLFNAMSAFQSREPGMVGAIYDDENVLASVVCDGVHVDFAAIRISKRLLGERMFYITDAVAELKEGEYQHIFRGDRFTLPDGTLSGSSLTMMKCVSNGVQHVGIGLDESLRMATAYPAKLLGSSTITGYIEPGSEASFVVFDNKLEVVRTIVS